MHERKFDPRKLERLNDPERLASMRPDVLWEVIAVPDPQVIVDIGAGTGVFAFDFARRMSGGTVYALDTEQTMLDWIEAHEPDGLAPQVVTVRSGESVLPIPDEVADVAMMVNLHHELDDPGSSLGEAFRVTKPGGRLLIVDWKAQDTRSGPPLAIRISADVIREQVEAAGFEEIAVREDLLPMHAVITATRT